MARPKDTPTDDAPTNEPELPETLAAGFTYLGTDDSPDFRDYDDVAIPVDVIHVYARPGDPNTQLGVYRNATYDDDGYPWTVARNYVDVYGDAGWKHTYIAKTDGAALREAERSAERE